MNEERDEHVDESEFSDLAQSPAEVRAVKKALEMVAGGGAGDTLKEMAQEVLTGRIGLREALDVSAYTEQIAQQSDSVRERWDGKSEGEREALAAEGDRHLEELQREIDKERAEKMLGGASKGVAPRHSGGSWSL
ncbi:hypothetical protein OG775_37840 [Streptomyces platensis]|uniref:hypothetical protein n=1 Tax=Streptomyces platensis TaxID=58346 RepID=UPI0022537884|nr:hypothetical protein [Streptomyces platensis]MCX4640797.1 hypothetical protein [Streptomyces platensis]